MFSSGIMNFRCGVVRISEDCRILDKNKAAERLVRLPRRGSFILKLLGQSAGKLDGLSQKPGSSCVVTVSGEGKKYNVTAIREESGNILLLFHPLLSMLRFADNALKNPRIPVFFMLGMLDLIYNCSERERVPKAFSSGFPLIDFSVKRPMFTEDVMNLLAEKLGKTDLWKDMTVRFESRHKDRMFIIDFQTVIYAFTELLYADSALAGEGKAEIKVTSDPGGLEMVLSDTCRTKVGGRDEAYLKLIGSVLRLAGALMETEYYGQKRIVLKITVPVKQFTYFLHIPEIYAKESLFYYFDYALSYYGVGKPIEDLPEKTDNKN